jgi:heme exporter protein B
MNGFNAILCRDLTLSFRRWGDVANPLLFYVIVATLFPLALAPDATQLRLVGTGVLWVTALLATLIGLPALFQDDIEDGAMEQLVLSRIPFVLIVTSKILAHWLVNGFGLLLVAPIVAYSFNLPAAALPVLLLALLIATPGLSVLGALGAALTVTLKRGSNLHGLLILPLSCPLLIFGARVTDLAIQNQDVAGPLYLMAAMTMLAITTGPLAAAAALRVALE